MRLCRFSLDDLILAGFYADDRVIPIDQAAEAYCEDVGVELLLPTTDDLLDLLPPDGAAFDALRDAGRLGRGARRGRPATSSRSRSTTSSCSSRSATRASSSSWPATTPRTSSSAAGSPPSGTRRSPTSS